MRIRLFELWPLLLVGVVLIVYQLSHPGTSILAFLPLTAAAPTPTVVVRAAGPPTPVPSTRRTGLASPTPLGTACTAARPRFVGGMLALKAALGTSMGEPLECERAVSDDGNTQQKTTTGLAYYEHALNTACFTTGWDHWALTSRGLTQWTGEAVDPPSDAAIAGP